MMHILQQGTTWTRRGCASFNEPTCISNSQLISNFKRIADCWNSFLFPPPPPPSSERAINFKLVWFLNASKLGSYSYVLKVITEHLVSGFLYHSFIRQSFFVEILPSLVCLFVLCDDACSLLLNCDTQIFLCNQISVATFDDGN
jgi:hypothetical protein